MSIVVRSLATANPARYATQKETFEYLDSHFKLEPKERQLYAKILLDGPLKGRYFGIDHDEQMCQTSPEQLIARFLKFGKQIGIESAQKAMNTVGLKSADIEGLVVNTCTGYLCPGLSSYIAEGLQLKNSTKVMDIMGMGCGAAIPNLECAASMLSHGTSGPILCIAVEICSATFFMGPSPELIISNSIFGDGAAAVILDVSRNSSTGLLNLIDFETGIFPNFRDELRYRNEDGRLRNSLTLKVPAIGAQAVWQVSHNLLTRNKLEISDIDYWIVHPGGTMVLEEVARKFGLTPKQLRRSYDIFENYGNMSSPSVLFVLKKTIDEAKPVSGQKGLLLSFGAGFTAFAALIEF